MTTTLRDAGVPLHVHRCHAAGARQSWDHTGPCVCSCGAVLERPPVERPLGTVLATRLPTIAEQWAWHLPDGSWAPFPDHRSTRGGRR